jgi:hypothetical protein
MALVLAQATPHKGFKRDLTYSWMAFNAVVICFLLDGGLGYLQAFPPLRYVYHRLDHRYASGDHLVKLISLLELTLYTPLCLAAAYLHKTMPSSVLKEALVTVASSFQLFGTLLFLGGIYLRNFEDVCGESCFALNPEHIVNFWVVNCLVTPLWIVIPLVLVGQSVGRLESAFIQSRKSKIS